MPGRIIVEQEQMGVKYVTVIPIKGDDVENSSLKEYPYNQFEDGNDKLLGKQLLSPKANLMINPTGEKCYFDDKQPLTEPWTNEFFPQELNNFTKPLKKTSAVVERGSLTDPLVNVLPVPQESHNGLNKTDETRRNHLQQIQAPKETPAESKPVKLRDLINARDFNDTLHSKAIGQKGCGSDKCLGSLLLHPSHRPPGQPRDKAEVIDHAKDFLQQFYEFTKQVDSTAHEERLQEVLESIETRGTYDLTTDELIFGTKTAWRNAPRCLGRIQWSNLKVFDARHVTTARGMFEALCEHIKYATNEGNIRSAITVFPQRTDGKHDYRVWNSQLIHYAGYTQPDGSVIGDPVNVDYTELCVRMGWRGRGGMFDILPMVLSANGEDPELFEIPAELVLQTEIKHPKYPWFSELGLRWYCVPAVSNMMFDCGGLEFTASPFNGWYMGTEIGARDLCDTQRYNILEKVAVKMGLDVNANTSLWKDRVLVEVNIAVLYSFQQAKVTITDHHTVSETFMTHFQNEQRVRGGCPADWVWLVPPMSGSILPVFHQEMLNYSLKPSYEYQDIPWKTHVWRTPPQSGRGSTGRKLSFFSVACVAKVIGNVIHKIVSKRVKCTILYATETGKSEGFARKLHGIFRTVFHAKVFCMDDYDVSNLHTERLVLIVTSTFGNGDPPENGKSFAHALLAPNGVPGTANVNGFVSGTLNPILPHLRYSVFGLGSTAYPTFCAFGHHLDSLLEKAGAQKIHATGEGDELYAQEQSFKKWAADTFMAACAEFSINRKSKLPETLLKLSEPAKDLSEHAFRLTPLNTQEQPSLCDGLSHLHKRTVTSGTLAFRENLQSSSSSRQTILIKVDSNHVSELSHEPGDHLAIFPANPKLLVNAVLARLDDTLSSDQLVKVEKVKDGSIEGTSAVRDKVAKFPPFTLRTALTYYLDITSPPSPNMLNALAEEATRETEAEELKTLGSGDPDAYHLWLENFSPNLIEVLTMFPSVKISSTFLIAHLPVLKHRFYSISSSSDVCPGEIHATLGVVQWQSQGGAGPIHQGVCSNWLNTCEIGETIPCFIRKAGNFHLPEDGSLPIIMVGPGTGIAPFRSFWQQRQFDMKRLLPPQSGKRKGWGKMTLYTGCRQAGVDDLYTEEIKQAKKKGVISKHYMALSRQPGTPKMYAQDLLMKNASDVYKAIVKNGGHFYICGDVVMASEVNDALQMILQKCGQMSSERAKAYISQMKKSNRLHEDIFGVMKRETSVKDNSTILQKQGMVILPPRAMSTRFDR